MYIYIYGFQFPNSNQTYVQKPWLIDLVKL